MLTSPLDALQTLRDLASMRALAAFCAEQGITLLVVFGSVLEEYVVAPHDLDVAVLLDPDVDLVAVETALIRLLRLDGIDVMDARRAGVVARDQALSTGLRTARAGLRVRSHARAAIQERMETARLRRLDLALLAQER